jgi:hypothetical protein
MYLTSVIALSNYILQYILLIVDMGMLLIAFIEGNGKKRQLLLPVLLITLLYLIIIFVDTFRFYFDANIINVVFFMVFVQLGLIVFMCYRLKALINKRLLSLIMACYFLLFTQFILRSFFGIVNELSFMLIFSLLGMLYYFFIISLLVKLNDAFNLKERIAR